MTNVPTGPAEQQCLSARPLTPDQAEELISRIQAALIAAQAYGAVMVKVDAEAMVRAESALHGASERAYAAVMALAAR